MTMWPNAEQMLSRVCWESRSSSIVSYKLFKQVSDIAKEE